MLFILASCSDGLSQLLNDNEVKGCLPKTWLPPWEELLLNDLTACFASLPWFERFLVPLDVLSSSSSLHWPLLRLRTWLGARLRLISRRNHFKICAIFVFYRAVRGLVQGRILRIEISYTITTRTHLVLHHLPSPTITKHHLPLPTITYHHLQSLTITYNH